MHIQQSKRESEDRAFGTSSDHRVDRFEEALQIIVPLLRTGQVDFEGRHYQAWDCELRSCGSRPGGPLILITERRASACYAERRLMPASGTPKGRCAGPRGSSRCGQHLSAKGEQPKLASPDEIVDMLRGYACEGCIHVQLWLSPSTVAGLEWFAGFSTC